MITVEPTGGACGASVRGIDLTAPIGAEDLQALETAWYEHHVLVFPEQRLSDEDLVAVARAFGGIGDDPFFESIAPGNPVVAIKREADETAPVFAQGWHTDWSFKAAPPRGTCLYGITIPPVGGETGFCNQQQALAEMPGALRARLEGRTALHSAATAYAPEGLYGEQDPSEQRSMRILYSESARAQRGHPIILEHPESGRETLFGCAGYICGIEGMDQKEADALVGELYAWQTQERFQYTHRWETDMLVIWDNRSVLHRAYAGFDGHARELHRVTIRGAAEF